MNEGELNRLLGDMRRLPLPGEDQQNVERVMSRLEARSASIDPSVILPVCAALGLIAACWGYTIGLQHDHGSAATVPPPFEGLGGTAALLSR